MLRKWIAMALLAASVGLQGSSADEVTDLDRLAFDEMVWQTGDVSVMRLFEPYIGTFRSTGKTSPSGTDYYFTVDYRWYDRDKSIVKYSLATHLPDTGEVRPLGEGFYRFDRLSGRIAVVGVFRDGRSGSGYMTPFDPASGYREVRIRAVQPDGTPAEVRDTFWTIDENSWGNRTFLRGDDGEWRQVSEDTYRRVGP